jgi:non-specific serine/threonine protein kinase
MSMLDTLRAGALPVEYSSFVGRRKQLVAARTALGPTSLLTLVGPGGVGKTRFAVQIAQSVRKLYPDGTWFVDLSGVSGPGSVVDEVGRIVGSQGVSPDGIGAIVRFLESKRALLVLDNCEQVVDQCASLVRRILDECEAVAFIATSREALRIGAETIFPVDPLDAGHGSSSPAQMLFLARCASVLPDPTAAELEAITEICRRLDGLPLAIELAASRVAVLTPAQILERLAEPLEFLTGRDRDAPNRQQTIRAAIAWSYELCSEQEQAMWRQMSVFVGGWDLASAEWMSDGSIAHLAVLDLVQSLLEKSIIRRRQSGGVVYYEMLDTVRRFGFEMHSADEIVRFRARHRDLYLARLATLEADWYGPNQAHWLALSRRELPNIRAAVEYCLENADAARAATLLVTAWRVVWQAQGRIDELGRWCARVVELDAAPTPDICQAMTILGGMQLTQGATEAGTRRLDLASELAQRLGDGFSHALALTMRGSAGGDPERALALYTEALAALGGSNPIPARANFEERVAGAHDRLGHIETANRLRDNLIARAIEAGESFETVFLLFTGGGIAANRGDFDNALLLLRQALSLAQNLEHGVVLAMVEEKLAIVAAASGDYVRAAMLIGAVHSIVGAIGAIATAFPADASWRPEGEALTRRMLGTRDYDSAVARGNAFSLTEGIAYALGTQLPSTSKPRSRPSTIDTLTTREMQVAALVGQGLSDKEIAARLVISRRTAEGHVANSLTKLGFTSRSQLAVWTARET